MGSSALRVAAVLLLALGLASGQTDQNTPEFGGLIDTSGMSFYGFYGFYGITPGSNIECDVVVVTFNLYNYGAQDLTSVSTIRYIIDQTKVAIAATVNEAVPTGAEFTTQVTELDGSAVTYVSVTVEVEFAVRADGGAFASYLGVTEADLTSETFFLAPPVPTSGECSTGVDIVVQGYTQSMLEDENNMVAFQQTVTSAFQASVQSIVSTAAADDMTVELVGITDNADGGVSTRAYLHYASDTAGCKAFEERMRLDPTHVAAQMVPLVGDVRIIEATEVTDDIGDNYKRKLLQNSEPTNHLSTNIAAAGLGVNSINPESVECRIIPSSSVYGASFYGIYGSSAYGFYAYDTSATATGESSSAFYGFSAPSGSPSSSPSRPSSGPSRPSRPSGPSPVYTPAPAVGDQVPVYFTTILSDFNIEDLSSPADRAQFEADYTAAVSNAITLLGITSNPTVSVLDVTAASVAVPTVVVFTNDPEGAQLFMQVLSSNPSLAFPAFSSLGSISITDVSTAESANIEARPAIGSQETTTSTETTTETTAECAKDFLGDSCCAPATLAADNSCCWQGVDECGVCGGDSSTCATTATVRVATPKTGLSDTSSPEFQALLADFKEGIAALFTQFSVSGESVEIDASKVATAVTAEGMTIDIPFKFMPAPGAAPPSATKTRAILMAAVEQQKAYKDMTLTQVLDVARAGVCGNNVCEIGEFHASTTAVEGLLCAADCSREAAPSVPTVETPSTVDTPITPQDSSSTTVDANTKSTEGEPAPKDNSKDIILGVVFGLLGLILIGLLCYYVFVMRKKNAASKEEGLAFSSQQQVPASNEEPEIPTRQVTENTV